MRRMGKISVAAAILLAMAPLGLGDEVEGGGVILIGPIPIVFGSSPEMALLMILLGGALTLLTTSFFLLMGRKAQTGPASGPGGEGEYFEKSGTEHRKDSKKRATVKGSGVVMIGPIPIVFGSDPSTATLMMLIGMVLMLVSIAFFF